MERIYMNKIDLYLINGALGAGKTTLLRYLLRQDRFRHARVIENEFAAESIDTALLSDHVDEVSTIAGACICCSTGDELLTALQTFARSGDGPVIIESTGVANTLKVIEKLVVNDVFEQYRLVQSLYVIDGLETQAGSLAEEMRREVEAADMVLVSKLDKLPTADQQALHEALTAQGLSHIVDMDHGAFPLAELGEESHILDYFTEFDGEITMSDTPTYSVIDTTALVISPEQLATTWETMSQQYGLRRLKGGITDGTREWHVEATPRQFIQRHEAAPHKLVFIGERANEISRSVFIKELGQ